MEAGKQSTLNDMQQMYKYFSAENEALKSQIENSFKATVAAQLDSLLPKKVKSWNEVYRANTWAILADRDDFMGTGGYLVNVTLSTYMAGGVLYRETYSGIMSFFEESTNSNDVDEIALHSIGHAKNGSYIKLRTRTQYIGEGGRVFLEMLSNESWDGSQVFTLSVTRLS